MVQGYFNLFFCYWLQICKSSIVILGCLTFWNVIVKLHAFSKNMGSLEEIMSFTTKNQWLDIINDYIIG